MNRVLHTGKDFVFIGFDGRADRTLGERRIKRSPLRDVASMLLSFQYAAQAVFFDQLPGVTRRPETMDALEFWSRYWSDWVSATFLKGYLDALGQSSLAFPQNDADLRLLLDHCLLEQALEGASEELRSRPDWARVPHRNAAANSRNSPPGLKSYALAGVHTGQSPVHRRVGRFSVKVYEAPRNTASLYTVGHLSSAVQQIVHI